MGGKGGQHAASSRQKDNRDKLSCTLQDAARKRQGYKWKGDGMLYVKGGRAGTLW
jgi:hypothetical protein